MNQLASVEILGEPEALELERAAEIADDFTLSPYVLAHGSSFEMLLRLVNRNDDPSKKISRVFFAQSDDGRRFAVGPQVIAPGASTDADGGGAEDPTVVRDGAGYAVFYSGYDAVNKCSSMLAARGATLGTLQKTGAVLPQSPTFANAKEASVVATESGYRMFFEYARGGASHIGVADAASLSGPWTYAQTPLVQRPGLFDAWHLSPAAIVRRADGTHVLFYNGSTKSTNWRIGYAILNADATHVLERPEVALLGAFGLEAGDTDIAFAASAVVAADGRAWLYYSIADRRLFRSSVRY